MNLMLVQRWNHWDVGKIVGHLLAFGWMLVLFLNLLAIMRYPSNHLLSILPILNWMQHLRNKQQLGAFWSQAFFGKRTLSVREHFSHILLWKNNSCLHPRVNHRSKQAIVEANQPTPLLPSLGGWRRWLGPLAIAVPHLLAVATFVEALVVVTVVAISHENVAMEERCFWGCFWGMCLLAGWW